MSIDKQMSIDEQMSRAIEFDVNPSMVQDLLGKGANKTKALEIATEYKNGLDNATNNVSEDKDTITNLDKIIEILKSSSGGKKKSKKQRKSKKRRKTTKRRKM
jgi:hypothetical protein